jgi:UrcA family protein
MQSLPVLVALAALSASHFTAADAASKETQRSEMVRYADLDLNSTAGATTRYHRPRHAAADVCTEPTGGAEFAALPLFKHCVNRALSEAVATVDQPVVTAYAQAQGVDLAPHKNAQPN